MAAKAPRCGLNRGGPASSAGRRFTRARINLGGRLPERQQARSPGQNRWSPKERHAKLNTSIQVKLASSHSRHQQAAKVMPWVRRRREVWQGACGYTHTAIKERAEAVCHAAASPSRA